MGQNSGSHFLLLCFTFLWKKYYFICHGNAETLLSMRYRKTDITVTFLLCIVHAQGCECRKSSSLYLSLSNLYKIGWIPFLEYSFFHKGSDVSYNSSSICFTMSDLLEDSGWPDAPWTSAIKSQSFLGDDNKYSSSAWPEPDLLLQGTHSSSGSVGEIKCTNYRWRVLEQRAEEPKQLVSSSL